jgi:hypothetical protein
VLIAHPSCWHSSRCICERYEFDVGSLRLWFSLWYTEPVIKLWCVIG